MNSSSYFIDIEEKEEVVPISLKSPKLHLTLQLLLQLSLHHQSGFDPNCGASSTTWRLSMMRAMSPASKLSDKFIPNFSLHTIQLALPTWYTIRSPI